jgi:hypothetical protein
MASRLHDETAMMGKLVIVWVLLLALVAAAAVDTVSIMFTTFHLSDVASQAAGDGVAEYRSGHDTRKACEAAAETVRRLDDTLKLPKDGFCAIDPSTGNVTITVKATAKSVLAGRLSFTKEYTQVVETETAGRSSV